jgi:hypothetical protein
MRPEMVAPCGMNCMLCSAYLARHLPEQHGKPKCAGCRPRGKMCAFIKRDCAHLSTGEYNFCFECASFPCDHLSKLDKRYRERYRTSFVENLKVIQTEGMDAFLKAETERHRCPACGGVVCIHDDTCYECKTQMGNVNPKSEIRNQ